MPVKETNLIMKAKDFQSSFLSCPKDIEEILRKLFYQVNLLVMI